MAKSSFLDETIKDNDTLSLVRSLVVESERKYRALVDNANVGIYVVDDSRVLYVNSYLSRLTGYAEEELVGMQIKQIIDPKYLDEVMARVLHRLKGNVDPQPTEFRLVCKDGSAIDVSGRANKCVYEGQQAIIGTMLDLTEIKSVKARVAHLEEVIESVPMPVLRIDVSERISDANQSAERLFRDSGSTLQNVHLASLLVDENPQRRITDIFLRSRRNVWNGKLSFLTGAGESIEASVSAIPIKNERSSFAGITLLIESYV
jgi:PAS domain S-box-containing protein